MVNAAKLTRNKAFTLVELIVVIVVLAILSGVAIPKYFDYAAKAKESACKATLGAVRSAIANFYANTLVNNGTAAYPTLVQMQTTGTVMQETLAANPYNNSSTIAAATYSASAPPTTGNAGWNYDAASGKFWANTNTSGVGENSW
ncbi:MAG TPA: prepilin-type N-terminal cleavage/methylation domain-containing protein [Phycisphaerales bacterium]|nr:prepilin-type N-terminal cleavage/methylation domain-containing protein [Phycisphaerales bacterium]